MRLENQLRLWQSPEETTPPARLLLPRYAESLLPLDDFEEIPRVEEIKLGKFLGSGIDKDCYEILDGNGKPRQDVVVKRNRHGQDLGCQGAAEVALWDWLRSENHPLRIYFAGVVAICEDTGGGGHRGYLVERAKSVGMWNDDDDLQNMKTQIENYLGIYDLHYNNIGSAIADGRPVCLDYGLAHCFDTVAENWENAKLRVAADASPAEILEECETVMESQDYSEEEEVGYWCDSCETRVSCQHCACEECRVERNGEECRRCGTRRPQGDMRSHPEANTGGLVCWSCEKEIDEERAEETSDPEDTAHKIERGELVTYHGALIPRVHCYPSEKWKYNADCGCFRCLHHRLLNTPFRQANGGTK